MTHPYEHPDKKIVPFEGDPLSETVKARRDFREGREGIATVTSSEEPYAGMSISDVRGYITPSKVLDFPETLAEAAAQGPSVIEISESYEI